MDVIMDLLFSIGFKSYPEILIRMISLFIICGIIIYLIYLVINQLTNRSKVHKDYLLKLNFLRSLIVFQLLFLVYFYFLIKKVGLGAFQWSDTFFWLGFSPQLLIFIGVIILFFTSNGRFQKSIKR